MYLDLLPIISNYWLKPMLGLGLVLLIMRRPAFRSAAFMHNIFLLSLLAVLVATAAIPSLPEVELKIVPESWVQLMRISLVGENNGAGSVAWLYTLLAIYVLGVSWCASYTYASWQEAAKLTTSAQAPDTIALAELGERMAILTKKFEVAGKSVSFKISDDIQSPLVWRWRSPIIVLPASYRLWSQNRLERVLAHELAHIERNDWLSKIGTRILCVLAWPLPFVWLISKKINWYAEVACDDRVVQLLNCRAEYADDLLSLSTDQKLSVFALSYLRSSELYQRINMVLDPCRMKNRPGFSHRALLFVALVLGFIPIAVTRLNAASPLDDIWYPYPTQLPLLLVPEESPIADGNDRFAWQIRQQFLQARADENAEPEETENSLQQLQKVVTTIEYAPQPVRAVEEFVVTSPSTKPNPLYTKGQSITTENTIRVPSPAVSIRGYIPTKIVTPRYPRKALERNISGRVVVRFDVNEQGYVVNQKVVETTSGKVFNRVVLDAITKFRFTPLSIDGVPVITKNVHETFVFTL